MLSFYTLPQFVRALILLVAFTLTSVDISLIFFTFKRKTLASPIGVGLCALFSFTVFVFYTSHIKATALNIPQGKIGRLFCKVPVIYIVIVLAIIGIYTFYLCLKERKIRSNAESDIIKEAFDAIDAGLCFANDNGIILLANRCIQRLSYAIIGDNIFNANEFWRALNAEAYSSEAERLSLGTTPTFRLPDGTVWTFALKKIGQYIQISATNTTQTHIVTEEIKKKNIKLAAINLRLRKYSESVNELTRSKERLETKARIHSELGQVLLSTRRYLLYDNDGKTPPLDAWKRTVAMLRRETANADDELPLNMLKRIADSTGVTVNIQGNLPEPKYVQQLFMQAAIEALTNAVIHAKAKTLSLTLNETETAYTVSFTNDGSIPEKDITEGGGLSSLRKKARRLDGDMHISSKPRYKLTITLPKKRSIEL